MREDFGNSFKEKFEEKRERWENSMKGRRGNSHIGTGVFILLIGVAALLKASITDLPAWIFSWQTFLIALGFFIGIKHGFRRSSWLILILIGVAFLLRDFYPDLPIRRYIWPGILILCGIMLIFKPRRRHGQYCTIEKKKDTINSGIEESADADEAYEAQKDYQEDFVDSTSIFGGAKKNIISKNFSGGDIINIFGGTELDLSRADFKGTVIIELTTIFGGTKLIVPSNWIIKSEAVTIFGGLEDKRNSQTLSDNPEKILLLKGTVIFGGIEIKSF